MNIFFVRAKQKENNQKINILKAFPFFKTTVQLKICMHISYIKVYNMQTLHVL